MVAIGEGAKARVEQTFASMGSNLLIVLPGSSQRRRGHGRGRLAAHAHLGRPEGHPDRGPGGPRGRAGAARRRAGHVARTPNWSTSIQGTTPDFLGVRSWPVAAGARFSQTDVDGGIKVALLGQTVVDKLFGPNANPVGAGRPHQEHPLQGGGRARQEGPVAHGPGLRRRGVRAGHHLPAEDPGRPEELHRRGHHGERRGDDGNARAQQQIRGLLRDRHRLAVDADDDFPIRNLSEIASAQQEGTKTLTTLLMAIAAVSLLVGGIGIMNIMLVSVTERTREIGVRMAVGARARDIQLQFLVEALTLSVAGGLIGVAAGLAASPAGWPAPSAGRC